MKDALKEVKKSKGYKNISLIARYNINLIAYLAKKKVSKKVLDLIEDFYYDADLPKMR